MPPWTIALLLTVAGGGPLPASARAATSDTLSVPSHGAPPPAASSVTTAPPIAPSVAAASAARDRLGGAWRADRLSHASLALAIGVGAGLASREPAAGAGTSLALTVAKELLDDRFDRGDLAAGAAGAALACLIAAALAR